MVNTDFTIFPIIYTERLMLKEITDNDASVLFKMTRHADIMKYIDRQISRSMDDIHELIQKMEIMISKGESV